MLKTLLESDRFSVEELAKLALRNRRLSDHSAKSTFLAAARNVSHIQSCARSNDVKKLTSSIIQRRDSGGMVGGLP